MWRQLEISQWGRRCSVIQYPVAERQGKGGPRFRESGKMGGSPFWWVSKKNGSQLAHGPKKETSELHKAVCETF